MDTEKIDGLLLDAFEQAAANKSKLSEWAYKRLKTSRAHGETVMSRPHSFAEVIDILSGIGTFAEVDYERNSLVLLTTSGFMGMNPAVVELSISGGAVYANAHAKEGLMNQGTADKAIEKVFEELLEHR